MLTSKLKGGALYVSVIISILISIILSLFILLAYFNSLSIQSQVSLQQLSLSVESGFEIAQSDYYLPITSNMWQKMDFNSDSLKIKKMPWGCYSLIDVHSKNNHNELHKTGLFGCFTSTDTALIIVEKKQPIGLAGNIKWNGLCYIPKSGIKSAYIEGRSFSDLNSLKPFIRAAPNNLPAIDETYLKEREQLQTELNSYTDSLMTEIPQELNQAFRYKTAVIQQGNLTMKSQKLSNNIKIISYDVITIENTCQLNNVLLIARKVVFKKGFRGRVHVIAKDSIVTEDACVFNYPSSFFVYRAKHTRSSIPDNSIRGIFFGESCQFGGGLLAATDKAMTSKMMIRTNKHFELIGNLYSSDYADVQGNFYGSLFCQSLLLQTPSATYENHLLNCLIDPKKYGRYTTVPNWHVSKRKQTCAQWF